MVITAVNIHPPYFEMKLKSHAVQWCHHRLGTLFLCVGVDDANLVPCTSLLLRDLPDT